MTALVSRRQRLSLNNGHLSHKALFYKEKQRLKSIGIASYNQEEKYPESSQKPKK